MKMNQTGSLTLNIKEKNTSRGLHLILINVFHKQNLTPSSVSLYQKQSEVFLNIFPAESVLTCSIHVVPESETGPCGGANHVTLQSSFITSSSRRTCLNKHVVT